MPSKLDSQEWRDQLDGLRKRFNDLYKERAPILQDYENTVNQSLSDLIGEVVPAAREYFDASRNLTGVVNDQYAPAVGEYIQSARDYDTPERRMQAREGAITDVMGATDAARKSALDRLESYGIDPSVTRSASLDQNARVAGAIEAVKQARDASADVEERGRAYMSDALRFGEGAAQGSLAYGQAGAGMLTSATNAANTVGSTWANIYGTPVQNLEAQKGLIESSLNMKATEVASKQAAAGGSPWGAIGQTVGTVGGAVVGAYLGGPAGATLGAQAGGAIGGAAGGAAGGGGGGGSMTNQAIY